MMRLQRGTWMFVATTVFLLLLVTLRRNDLVERTATGWNLRLSFDCSLGCTDIRSTSSAPEISSTLHDVRNEEQPLSQNSAEALIPSPPPSAPAAAAAAGSAQVQDPIIIDVSTQPEMNKQPQKSADSGQAEAAVSLTGGDGTAGEAAPGGVTGGTGAASKVSHARPNGTAIHSSFRVPISVLPEEGKRGVCLDGSPPAYYLSQGWGDGANKWMVFLQGGGWCFNAQQCKDRAATSMGSSKYMDPTFPFSGVLSNNSATNPYFFDWNIVYVAACDGCSFSGTLGEQDGVHFEGKLIFRRIISYLLETKGMDEATHAILGGFSSGGLGALLRCDEFYDIFKTSAFIHNRTMPAVKCMVESSFFPLLPSYFGSEVKEPVLPWLSMVVNTHGPAVSPSCLRTLPVDGPTRDTVCFFASSVIRFTTTPVFVINSMLDPWSLNNVFLSGQNVPEDWKECRQNVWKCNPKQLTVVQGFGQQMVDKVKEVLGNKATNLATSEGASSPSSVASGAFLFSCPFHTAAHSDKYWNLGDSAFRIGGLTMAEAAGQWFYEESVDVIHVDCVFPCKPTCPH